MNGHPSLRSWSRLLAMATGAVVSMGIVARAAHAEGVVDGGFYAANASGGSLTAALGDIQSPAPAANNVSTISQTVSRRLASKPSQSVASAETAGDIFRHSRLALPLVMQAAVGGSPEAEQVSGIRPMKGPMVGLRPHPKTWGSTFER